MSSKRKKSKNRLNAKNSLGISRKKNYTKDSAKLLIQNDNNESIDILDIKNNEQSIVNVDSALSYPYLKREILQIFSTFSVIFIILIGLIFLL